MRATATPLPGRAYVANRTSNNVTVIDTTTNTVLGAPIPVGSGPLAVGVDPTVHRAYVANNGSDNVVVLRKKNGSILRTYGAGKDPFGIAFDGVNIWVANSGDNTVSSSISLL